MNNPQRYELRIEGHLSERWSEWFDGMTIRSETNGLTTLSGTFVDQPALFGALNKIHSLNLTLVSVRRIEEPK